jgi:hypothetical protein
MLNLPIINYVFVFNLIKFQIYALISICFLFFKIRMDPFVLSRNAFHIYCSEYINTNSSDVITNQSERRDYEKAVRTLNQRYEYFLHTLDRLQASTENHNMNSITSKLSSPTRKRKNKRRMPKVFITVSCTEHQTKQQPNIKFN